MKKKYSKKLPKKTKLAMVAALLSLGGILLISYFTSQTQDVKYMEAITLGSEWFLNNENDEFIGYEYHIDRNYYTKEEDNTKELGALRTAAKSANFLNNEELKGLVKQGLSYYEYFIDYNDAHDFYYINLDGDNENIGASAYIILTLLEIDHVKKDEYIEKLADGIISLQEKNGKIKEYFHGDRNGNQLYYPGISAYALMKAYEYNQNEDYLDVVKKSFEYYSSIFESQPSISFVSQYSKAYNELYKITKDDKIADFIITMNDYVLKQHKPKQVCGSFQFENGIATATYMEGVISAYETAISSNTRQKARCYANYVSEAADYILKLQVTNDKKYKLPAIGGFLAQTSSKTVKAERSHHAIMALIEAYELKLLK